MTVETNSYTDHVRNPPPPQHDETVYFEIESAQNNIENIYPLNGGGIPSAKDTIIGKTNIIHIRPQYCNGAPLFSRSKMNPNHNNKTNHELSVKCGGKDVLASLSSPVNRSTEPSSSNLSSPVKRSCTDTANTQHSPKSFKVLSPCPSTPSSSTSSYLRKNRLSHSVDSTNLQTALKHVQARDNNLSSSCFAEITSEKNTSSDIDSELTCLSWLQGSNLLKEFSPSKRKNKSPHEFDINTTFPKDCHEDLKLDTTDPLSCNLISDVDKSERKPAYSFSTLIFMAIESTPNKRLPVKDIYRWIQDNFPYFQRAPPGWKNSIRHNLSLNKSFKKVDKEKLLGKGSLWTIDHQARAGLVQQLRKTSMCAPYPKNSSGGGGGRVGDGEKPLRLDRKLHRRDATGRFVPNHDDAEFDVAAAMCALGSSLGSSLLTDHDIKEEEHAPSQSGFDYSSSEELLQRWRTCIEPNEHVSLCEVVEEEGNTEEEGDNINCANNLVALRRSQNGSAHYTIEDFVDEVHSKLSFRSQNGSIGQAQALTGNGETLNHSLNVSMDEDYEFDKSDDESSEDEEMRANMIRLVEQENEENGSDVQTDSGYSEDGTPWRATHPTMLDHSYSRAVPSFPRPPATSREAKGVDALLHLANLASRELENLNNSNKNKTTTRTEYTNVDFSTESCYGGSDQSPGGSNQSPEHLPGPMDPDETSTLDYETSEYCESLPPVETAEKSCQYDSSHLFP